MKILQVIDSLYTGGAESLLVDLCLRWNKNGVSPHVFVLLGGNPFYLARLQDAGIDVTVSSQSHLYSPLHIRELATEISRKRFDLVHVHLHPAQLWAAMALRTTPNAPPGITTEHSTWNRRREHSWYRPIDRWVFSQFRLAVCIGSSTKNNLDQWLGPDICPTCVVANGIDLVRFHHTHTPARLPDGIDGAPTVLCVGSLTDRKDQETLVRAIAEIEGVHVLLVGEGPLKQAVQQIAQVLRIETRVHFLGVRHDIPELIAAATIYVQPSRVDGFCIATLEAMSGGLPVIVADIPGLADLARDCGLLFPVGDHLKLAESMRKLLLDSSLRAELAARGIAKAQQYSVDKTASQYQRIFESAVSSTVPGGHPASAC